jgi:hypothetical protein
MFARDRDLLTLEPTLFRDCGWRGQRVLKGEGDVQSGTLQLTAHDVSFEDARVEAGHVVLVGAGAGAELVPLEVLERLSGLEIGVSLLRADAAAPEVRPPDTSGAPVEVWTFAPQIALAHGLLMRAIGIEPEGSGGCGADGAYTPADIINTGAVRTLEALGAMTLIYAAAATPGSVGFEARAAHYRARFSALRQRTAVHLGRSANGGPLATRRFNTVAFIR